jgi:hypothetical protein
MGSESSEADAVLFQDAQVHHYEYPRLAGLLCRAFVDDIFLHPDRRNFELNGLIDNLFYKLWPAKDVDDVDFLGHVKQRSVRLFPQGLCDSGVDRDDAISPGLHVGGDSVTGPHRIVGKANHSEGLGAAEKCGNRISVEYRGHCVLF